MKNSKSALLAIAATALIASSVATPTLAQSHYDDSSRRQCGSWNFQYRMLAAASRFVRGSVLATASSNYGAYYGAANCQRF